MTPSPIAEIYARLSAWKRCDHVCVDCDRYKDTCRGINDGPSPADLRAMLDHVTVVERQLEEAQNGLMREQRRAISCEEERAQLAELLNCRAGRLLRHEIPFFMVKASEPYAAQVVDLIRAAEGSKWTVSDETWAQAALAEGRAGR